MEHSDWLVFGQNFTVQGPIARSLVSANRWLRGIKTYRFPWYLSLVIANHASSNPGRTIAMVHFRTFSLSWETQVERNTQSFKKAEFNFFITTAKL